MSIALSSSASASSFFSLAFSISRAPGASCPRPSSPRIGTASGSRSTRRRRACAGPPVGTFPSLQQAFTLSDLAQGLIGTVPMALHGWSSSHCWIWMLTRAATGFRGPRQREPRNLVEGLAVAQELLVLGELRMICSVVSSCVLSPSRHRGARLAQRWAKFRGSGQPDSRKKVVIASASAVAASCWKVGRCEKCSILCVSHVPAFNEDIGIGGQIQPRQVVSLNDTVDSVIGTDGHAGNTGVGVSHDRSKRGRRPITPSFGPSATG